MKIINLACVFKNKFKLLVLLSVTGVIEQASNKCEQYV